MWTAEAVASKKPIVSDNADDVCFLNAASGGLFIPDVKHWEELQKGDRIGRIIDPLSGAVLQEVESPVDGILFTIREYPIVDEGSLLGRLLKKEVTAL
jgi:predicted deacylase